jgi:hypothetical protein
MMSLFTLVDGLGYTDVIADALLLAATTLRFCDP